MKKNRFQIQQTLDGVRNALSDANDKLVDMYNDTTSKKEDREAQKQLVQDLEERESGLKAQLDAFDAEAAAKMNAPVPVSKKDKMIQNKAAAIRDCIAGNMDAAKKDLADTNGQYVINALSTATAGNGGDSLIPTTTANELITEPVYTNDLRPYIKVTHESKLEVPRLLFSCDDDAFVADEASAKEVKAKGDLVAFARNKSKLKTVVSETVLLGSDLNLVSSIDAALDGAAQYKEVKQLFAPTTATTYYDADMSFYATDGKTTPASLIKEVEGADLYTAITNAVADLPKMFRKNAKIIMSYKGYLSIINTLANSSATLYGVQPEMVLGKPVIFMDEATIPIVGDLNYLQINYEPETIFDRDKNVDTGMEQFVLTNWYDIQFRLRSAFRLAKVSTSASST